MDTITLISLLVGIIGTVIAVYQAALISASNKRASELQYILAGINNSALQKQQAWQNQISTLQNFETSQDWEMGRLYVRAKDDFAEIASLAIALEGAIDVNHSAISDMMEKSIKIVEQNNRLQAEGLKNPLVKPGPVNETPTTAETQAA